MMIDHPLGGFGDFIKLLSVDSHLMIFLRGCQNEEQSTRGDTVIPGLHIMVDVDKMAGTSIIG